MVSCSSEPSDLSDVAVFVTPANDQKVELRSGEKQIYDLKISTIHDFVKSLTITSFDKQNGEKILFEETYNEKSLNTTFVYTAPEILSEEAEVTLTFTVKDNLGNQNKATRKVTVVNNLVFLPQRTGIVLYSPFTGRPDALSLSDVSRPFNLADSRVPETADIYIDSNPTFTEVNWSSNTQTQFIRMNNFNYANATAIGLQAVYESSNRMDKITDIKVNDIIIVGHGKTVQGVFMVTNILRDSSEANHMIVNYKGIISSEEGDTGGESGEKDPENDTDNHK